MTESPSLPTPPDDTPLLDPATLDQFFTLAAARDLPTMLRRALSLIVQIFGAEAGSVLFQARHIQRYRLGAFREEALAQIDRWEESIKKRLAAGIWSVPAPESLPISTVRVSGNRLLLLNAPLLRDNRVVGSLTLVLPGNAGLKLSHHRTLSRLARGLGQMASLTADLALAHQRVNQLSVFYQVGQALVTTFDLHKLLQDTMQLAAHVIDAGAASIMLIDEENKELVFEVAHGAHSDLVRQQRIPLDEGIAGWVARQGKPVIANNARTDDRFSHRVDVRTGFLTQSIAAVPLRIKGRVIGVLELLNKYSDEGFDQEDLQLMTSIAAQAAIAIENARLYQSVRAERDRIIKAQEDVRRELARNLHDGTVQLLSAISMNLEYVQKLIPVNPETALQELQVSRNLILQATREARMVLFELRPIILETRGLIPALEHYIEQLQRTEKFRVHFQADPLPNRLGTTIAGTIFSIVQEAISNVKRHANAQNVWLMMAVRGRYLRVTVRDDGQGFDLATTEASYEERGSFGLLNMRERAELIGGVLTVHSQTRPPQQGTTLRLEVPLVEETAGPSDQTTEAG